jgi:hypothetical protein
MLGALYLLRFGRTRTASVAAALLTALAIFTKQTALLAALGFAAAAIVTQRRRSVYFLAPLALFTVLPFLYLNIQSGGWFSYYTVAQPAGHALIGEAFLTFWTRDLFRPLAIVCVLVLGLWLGGSPPLPRGASGFFAFSAGGFMLTAWAPRVKDGNWTNDLLPAYALLALLAGIALALFEAKRKAESEQRTDGIPALLYAALLVQFAALYYNPAPLVPRAADRAAGEQLIRSLRQYSGDIWIGHHGHYAALAGKPPHATALAIYDVLRSKNETAKTLLLDDVERALKARRFSAIVVDNDRFVGLADYAEYTRAGGVFPDPDVFWPVCGARTRPLRVYVPAVSHP